jgi:RNA polymerase I-specific transcription initiation factor RRN7
LQVILRHQIWFLVQEKGLPAELETVIYDLWALRIAQLGDRIASNDQESELQSQVFNTLDTDGTDDDEKERGVLRSSWGRTERKLADIPNLQDCLALCYLGITTLRLPFTPGDIYAWVTDGRLAYRRAIKLLPLAMKDRLPSFYHKALDPSALLTYNNFYVTLINLQIGYDKGHGVIWPVLNVPLLLFRYLKELALPLELYDATKRLGELLGHDFAPHYEDQNRLGIRHLPEAQLVSCLIVCIKLFYPLENQQRHPKSSSEPAAVAMNWNEWCKQMSAAEEMRRGESGRFTMEEMTKLQEKDVVSMGPDEIDQYLDFYAETYLDEAKIQRTNDTDDFRRGLYEMFPIEGEKKHPPSEMSAQLPLRERLGVIKKVHASMKVVPTVRDNDADILRPGEEYQLWKTEEELPEAAKLLYQKAAAIAGLSVDMLVLAVSATEARVEQWKRKQGSGGGEV